MKACKPQSILTWIRLAGFFFLPLCKTSHQDTSQQGCCYGIKFILLHAGNIIYCIKKLYRRI